MENKILLLTIGGSSSTNVHSMVKETSRFNSMPIDHIKHSGSGICSSNDVNDLKLFIRFYGLNLKINYRFVVVAKSAGGVLVWRYATTNIIDLTSMFKETQIILIDAHGAVTGDGVIGPYCNRRPLWFPKDYNNMNHNLIHWTNIHQSNSGLTGAPFKNNWVKDIHIKTKDIDHTNIVTHKTTRNAVEKVLCDVNKRIYWSNNQYTDHL